MPRLLADVFEMLVDRNASDEGAIRILGGAVDQSEKEPENLGMTRQAMDVNVG